MKTTVNFSQFHDSFMSIRPENFTYDGLRALYDWLIEYEEDTGTEVELDVIALCCDFTEYESAKEAAEEYGYSFEDMDDDEAEEEALEQLNNNTFVIPFDGGVIIQAY